MNRIERLTREAEKLEKETEEIIKEIKALETCIERIEMNDCFKQFLDYTEEKFKG